MLQPKFNLQIIRISISYISLITLPILSFKFWVPASNKGPRMRAGMCRAHPYALWANESDLGHAGSGKRVFVCELRARAPRRVFTEISKPSILGLG